MTDNFDKILDECIDRLNKGDSLEDCLTDHADCAEQLEPLLRIMLHSKETYVFVPSAGSKMEARQQFNAALEKIKQKRWGKQPLFNRLFARPMVLTTVAVAIVILVAGYLSFRTLLPSIGAGPDQETPIISQITPISNTQGNFRLLLSDVPIDDFDTLFITITEIGLAESNTGEWTVLNEETGFEPKTADLTKLIGDNATEIFNGYIPAGEYKKVYIYADNVTGNLTSDIPVTVKLPSDKLQISKSFTLSVNEDAMVNFVFDITVIKAGESQVDGLDRYILKPQIGESGPNQNFVEVDPIGKIKRIDEQNQEQNQGQHGKQEPTGKNTENPGKPGVELQLQIEGEPGLGTDVTLTVTFMDNPVEGATITVNGELVKVIVNDEEVTAETDSNGQLTIRLPDTPDKVVITATVENKSGELELEL